MCLCNRLGIMYVFLLCSLTQCSHADGRLHILTSLGDMYSFPAYLLRVNFIYQFKTRNIFLTVGDDEDMTPLIRSQILSLSLFLSLSLSPPPLPPHTVNNIIIWCSFSTECGTLINVIRTALLLLLVPSELSSLELNNNVQ